MAELADSITTFFILKKNNKKKFSRVSDGLLFEFLPIATLRFMYPNKEKVDQRLITIA